MANSFDHDRLETIQGVTDFLSRAFPAKDRSGDCLSSRTLSNKAVCDATFDYNCDIKIEVYRKDGSCWEKMVLPFSPPWDLDKDDVRVMSVVLYSVCVFFADCFKLECVWIIGKYVWRKCPFMEKRPKNIPACGKKVVTRSQDRFWSDGHALLWYQLRALPWRRGTFWTVMTISIAATTGTGWK